MKWCVCLVLALAACAQEQPEPASLLIEVSQQGRVTLDEIPVTVNELIEATTDRTAEIVEVRADPDAIWMHVQWVLAALGEAGFKTARCRVKGRAESVQVPVYCGVWYDKLKDPDPEWYLHEPAWWFAVVLSPYGRHCRIVSWTHPSEIVRRPRVLTERVRSLLRAPDINGVVIAAFGSTPFGFVMRNLVAIGGAGVDPLDVGLETLHPWDRDLKVLPAPPHEDPLWRWVSVGSLPQSSLYPVNLPVASSAVQDKDNDFGDRLIFDLTADGRLIHTIDDEPRDLSLEALRAHLISAAHAYDAKLAARGGGFEPGNDFSCWSKLFVLLRADQDVPWQHVKWVMAELRAAKIYKLQFGARIYPGPEFTQKEAERWWAGRHIHWPVIFEGKVACFLATGEDRPDALYVEVSLHESPARYTLDSKATTESDVLAEWVRARWVEAAETTDDWDAIGRVRAPTGVRFANVMEAINALKRAGVDKIDFAGITPAPEAVRKARRLPR